MPRKRPDVDETMGDRREEILRQAAAMFAERGYTQTTTRVIAERAQVSEGLIFHHFGNKMGVLRALAAVSQPDRLVVALRNARERPIAELPAILAAAWIDEDRKASLAAALARDAAHDPELRSFVATIVTSVFTELIVVLRARTDAGELRPGLDLDLVSDVVEQILLGYDIRMPIAPPRAPLENQLAFVFSTLRA